MKALCHRATLLSLFLFVTINTKAAALSMADLVDPTPQTITFSLGTDANKTYGDPQFILSATGGGSGNAILFSSSDPAVATIEGNEVTIVGAGTSTITASQAGNNDFAPAINVEQLLTVAKADQFITFSPMDPQTLGGEPVFSPNAYASSELPIEYTSSNPQVAAVTAGGLALLNAGETTVTASQPGNNYYKAAEEISYVLIVQQGPQPQFIVFSLGANANKTFGDEPFNLSAIGGDSGNPIEFISTNTNVATIEGSAVTIVGAGTTTIIASQGASSEYLQADDVEQELTVAKANQSITFDDLEQRVLGQDVNFTLSAFSTSGLTLEFTSSNSNVATVANSTVMILAAGETIITALQEGDNNYNPADPVAHHLIVVPGDFNGGGDDQSQSITFSLGGDASKIYGDPAFELTAVGGGSGNPVLFSSTNNEVATINGTSVTIVGAGTTSIIASQAGGPGFLPAADVEQVLTVAKADQSIIFESLDQKVIGQDGPFTLNAFSSSGLTLEFTSTNGAVATVANGIVMIGEPGETIITAIQGGDNNYNAAQPVSHPLIVVQGDGGGEGGGGGGDETQEQVILFTLGSDAVKVFGDGSFQLTALGGLSGNPVTFVSSNQEVAVIEGPVLTIVGAGNVTITASQAGSDGFYPAPDVEQALTINKANQAITFDALPDKTLGDGAFPLAAAASSGLPIDYHPSSSERVTVNDNTVTLVGAGRVAITAGQEGNTNYEAANPVEVSFCIHPSKPSISISGEHTETPVLTSNAPAGNQWFKDGAAIDGATTPSFTVSVEGIYTVKVTVDDCESIVSEPKNIIIMSAALYKDVGVLAYPNPVTDFLHIDGAGPGIQWSIGDLLDKKINVPVESFGTSHRADVRGLNSGMYVLRISDGAVVRLIKIIKQ